MGLHWFRRPKVSVLVFGPDIIVTMPGTSFRVIYTKTEDNRLIATDFVTKLMGISRLVDEARKQGR